ncbi:MAG TPA: TMEM175 family protein [Nannocystis sp.]
MDGRTVDAKGFRLRGREVSRLEALSDAVFGFAITLLVVSLEVPRTAAALFETMNGFVGFAACFALLFLIWHNQNRFFRRYGLNDGWTVALNGVLLFVIVFFVYPLKFVFTLVIDMMRGARPLLQTHDGVPVLTTDQWPQLMMIYGAGYMAVFMIFALLHLNALRLADVIELSELERHDTIDNVYESLLNVGIGAASVLLAVFGGEMGPRLSGLVYWLVGPVLLVHGWISGRARKQIQTRVATG